MIFPKPGILNASPMTLEEFRRLHLHGGTCSKCGLIMTEWDDGNDAYGDGRWICLNPNCKPKEKMKMEGYNEITLCGMEMCRVLAIGLNNSLFQENVRVRDIKITEDGKFKITITASDSTLVRDEDAV